jgi:formylglycine-generating enzyme required for sulfatase activity
VQGLASNPLLITIIALIHYKGTRLPDHRVELYDLCIQTLVETWREARSEAGPVGEPLRVANEIKVLAPFALWLQERAPGPGGAARRDAVRALLVDLMARQFKGDREAAEKEAEIFLELGQRQTGLLVERGEGWFGFFHPTFKEYLAARACVLEGQLKGVPGTWEVLQPHLDDAQWHEVILLTVGYKAIIEAQDEAAAYLIRKIASESDDCGENVLLAGRCLVDIGRGLVPDDCWEETVELLVPIMQDTDAGSDPNLPPLVPVPTRYVAAETLDRLGWLPDDLDAFVEISSPSSLGPTYVGKYPVTNHQFARFVDAGGYEERGRHWWSDEGWAWREGEPRRSWQRTDAPDRWDDPRFGKARRGCPVVGVSWYEAMAYCAWLSDRFEMADCELEVWRSRGCETFRLDPTAFEVRLPTDEDWVAAAGGQKEDRYPWGHDWNESFANTREGGTGGTSPVGMYPSGRSRDAQSGELIGVWDMAGNVWEWLASRYEGVGQEAYALRGGSWDGIRGAARVAVRLRLDPVNSSYGLGFRVVVSPIGSGC